MLQNRDLTDPRTDDPNRQRPPSLACRAASPVLKALWFIEDHLADAVCLEDIACASGVSRFHLSRTFVAVTGCSVMCYLRGRRLSQAARALASGAPDILSVALDSGYGSHEAFTRAFCSQFGITPERLRASGTVSGLTLTEALVMSHSTLVELLPPRQESGRHLLIAGFGERYTFDTNHGIPALWRRFVPRMHDVPHAIGPTTYGVCRHADGDGNFGYIAGVEVSSVRDLPPELEHVEIPPRNYLVFTHRGHVSRIRDTVYAIWNDYLPRCAHRAQAAPDFERYGDAFDPVTNEGDVEIWVPVE